jgi:anaerobic glycerol-3-phosphate dehydrogenase
VSTGPDFRAGQEGSPRYSNLWVAGSALAHADPIRERSREGLAVASAVSAVQAILAHLGRPTPSRAAQTAG